MKHLVFAIISIKHCFGAIQIYENHRSVQDCVGKIVQRIQLADTTNVALVNASDALAKELNLLSEPQMSFISKSFDCRDTVLYGIYVIQSANTSMLLRGLNEMKRDTFWNPRAKFVIVIDDVDMQGVSKLLLGHLIHDVAVIACEEVYWLGLDRDECDKPVFDMLRPVALCSQVQNVELFVAYRKSSLRGCHVKFEATNSWPFYINLAENEEDPTVFNDIFELVAKAENITIEVVAYDKSPDQLFDHMELPKLFTDVQIGNVEGVVGEFALTLNRSLQFDYVYPILVYYYTIITTRAKVLDNWSAALKLLGAKTLWGVFATFSVICIIVVSIGMFNGRVDASSDILIMFGYMLNNIPQKHIKSGLPYRLLLWNILLFAFIISSATQACIYSGVTTPLRGYQPDTLEDVNSSFQVVMSPFVHDYLYSHPEVVFAHVYDDDCNATIGCNTVVRDGQMLYTLSTNIDDKLLVWLYSDKNMFIIKEPMAVRQATMYLRRGSSLVEPFNRLLLRAKSAGLIDKKLEQIIFYETLIDQYRMKLSKPFQNKPQSLEYFKGIFLIMISGYCVTTIVFVIEISYKRNR